MKKFDSDGEFLKKLIEREIPERHASILRNVIGKQDRVEGGDQGDIPYELRVAYWRYKAIRDRIDMSELSTHDFVSIALMAGRDAVRSTEIKSEESIIDQWDRKEVQFGTPVKFFFRKKEMRGVLAGPTSDRLLMNVNDLDGESRAVPPKDVWVDREAIAEKEQAGDASTPLTKVKPKSKKETVVGSA